MAIIGDRDPFLDSQTQAALEKRSKELIGLGLIFLGALAALLLWSYAPEDPNWLVSTDAPVQNWLGRPGAFIAAIIVMIAGLGSWGITLLLVVWGVRFLLHAGQDRALGRLIFAPFAVAALAIYLATLNPGPVWTNLHDYGLGGLGGDTVLGILLTILPLGSSFAIKLMSLLMALAVLALGAFVLGFSRAELERGLRYFLWGLVVAYAGAMKLAGQSVAGAVSGARGLQALHVARQARRAEKQALETPEYDQTIEFAEDTPVPASAAEPERPGLFARMPKLIKRTEPETEEQSSNLFAEGFLPDGEARVQAKITDVIKARVRRAPMTPPANAEKHAPLTKGRGHGPIPLIANAVQGMRSEPPLTAMADEFDILQDDMAGTEDPMVAPVPTPPVPTTLVPTPPAPGTIAAAPITAPATGPITGPVAAAAINPVVPETRKVVQQPLRKAPKPSARAQAEVQPMLRFDDPTTQFELPPLGLLSDPSTIRRHHLSDEALEENARMLETVLDDYGVKGEIVSVRPGPVVTMYELEPAPGLKASRVIGLADDIARSMAALSARVSTVPGRSVIGIELPNDHREMVLLREILAAREFGDSTMKLPLALGKDIGGDPVVANLAKMPHLLIAGTTGSGKSVAINTMILSLLYKLTPEECRLIMIDPKMLELSVYDGIPHLLSPVVTDPKKAVVALKWVVGEMEERYRKMSKMGVRNIDGYNGRVKDALGKGELFSRTVQTGFDEETGEPIFETEEFEPKLLPYIVVVVDEMADLMMVAGKEIEACIQRLAQMARASGIHLIMATQRPSVDVITGTIKANFPTRISFQVTSKIDSRTILGEMGAEQLLGMGDMLYMAGGAKITRCHGPFVSDEEVEEIVNHLKAFGPPDYVGGVVEGPDEEKADGIDAVLGLSTGGNTNGEDALYDQAVAIVIKDRKCSTSYIQRKLAIGYNKAARLVEQMEDEGVVSTANHVGKREILVPEQ